MAQFLLGGMQWADRQKCIIDNGAILALSSGGLKKNQPLENKKTPKF